MESINKKSRHSETQLVKILKDVAQGKKIKEVYRGYGTADSTYYNSKANIVTSISLTTK